MVNSAGFKFIFKFDILISDLFFFYYSSWKHFEAGDAWFNFSLFKRLSYWDVTSARYKAKYGKGKIKRAKSLKKKKARKGQADIEFALIWYTLQYFAIFGPYQGKGLFRNLQRSANSKIRLHAKQSRLQKRKQNKK